MPLATATALFFASPFLITVFAIFFLKEEVGIRRWSAVIIGFIGVYIILNPNFNDFDYLSLTPVLCAVCYALSMIIIKKTSDKDDVYSQMFHFYIFAITISLIIYFFMGDGQYNNFDHPASQFIFRKWFSNLEFSLPYMIFIGVIGATGFLCFFTAYRIASPAVVSPFEYSILAWASLNGWIFFDEIPNQRTIVGMILIICGSIYIFVREKAQNQSIAIEKPLR
jgi:drug/metabolite transporter (DMT)-like permease